MFSKGSVVNVLLDSQFKNMAKWEHCNLFESSFVIIYYLRAVRILFVITHDRKDMSVNVRMVMLWVKYCAVYVSSFSKQSKYCAVFKGFIYHSEYCVVLQSVYIYQSKCLILRNLLHSFLFWMIMLHWKVIISMLMLLANIRGIWRL